jgi:transposase-like protein
MRGAQESILIFPQNCLDNGGHHSYRCRPCREGGGRTFLLDYSYAGQSPEIKEQIVEMAMNASGVRDTARVLNISPTTVIKELKKKNLRSSR